uniref:Uncharacterized protein n=1 Tax=Bionectria ochroleuca TaxID=29856 RepID=A0A0B7K850_BIOOC
MKVARGGVDALQYSCGRANMPAPPLLNISPTFFSLEEQRHDHVLNATGEFVKAPRERPISQPLIEKCIAESCCVRQEHAQGDLPLLLFQRAIRPQDLEGLELRAEVLQLLSVIEGKDPPLDELHARDARQHFGAGRNPKNVLERHGLVRCQTPLARRVRK